MISQLPLPDLLLWISIILSEIALSLTALRSCRNRPAFALFSGGLALKSLLLIAIANWLPAAVYGYAQFASAVVLTSLVLLAVAELYIDLLGPKLALPAGAVQRIAFLLVLTYPACILAALLCSVKPYSLLIHTLQVIENTAWGFAAGSLIVLILESRRLGLSWLGHVQSLLPGLTFFTSITLVGGLLMSYAPHKSTVMLIQRLAQSASLSTFIFWTITLWRPLPLPVKASPEQLAAAFAAHRCLLAEAALRNPEP
jgi:hypothetical protein